ncbi:uncharacterized protein IL334_001959 [Kwoniella shivajii]|uniref:Histone demethylase JARID1 n=1 Tax=Kwoniella shivajii TaxID=564305 RepID=A0ABZ1CTD0_9TREE|nr:hypothetical protein IL334_001959 [Kwoniella shivajii]
MNTTTSTANPTSYPTRTRMGSLTKPRTPRGTPNGHVNGNGIGDGSDQLSNSRPSIKASPSESNRRKPTYTSSLHYPEVLPAPTFFANEGELQRSQRRSKVEALTKLDRAGTPIQISSGPTATSFLPTSVQPSSLPQPISGPSSSRNPLHKPVMINPSFNPSTVRQEAPRHPPTRTAPRLFGIEECPVYYPTIEQFKDTMGYIASISEEAKPFGICKIVPPEGWKMPFTLDSEKFRFKTRLQRLNQLEAASRAKINFLDQLSMFHNQSSDGQVTIPKIDRQPLDLWQLRKEVNKSGGHLELDRTKSWNKITDSLGYKSSWSNQVRDAYITIILPFDNYSVRAKSISVSPLTPLTNNINGNGNSRPPAFATDIPLSPTQPQPRSAGRMGSVKISPKTRFSSRMAGISAGNQGSPLTTTPLTLSNGLAAPAEIERPSSASSQTLKIKVPGFSTRDGSESELSDADSSSEGSPKNRKNQTPEYKKGDVCEICRFGHSAEKILLCDGCDRGFHTYCLDPPLASVPTNEEWFCTSCLLSQGDDFGFEEGEDHSIASFQARDSSFSWHWWNRHRPVPSSSTSSPPRNNSQTSTQISNSNPLARNFGKVSVTEDDVEREFWRLTESQSDTVDVEYGADVHSTTHGSAGPTMETHPLDSYAADGWNLNNMPILPDSLLRYIRSDISGMTVPWIYLGMMFSTFCWHNEDHYTYSVNYMYWGETKTWYGIPGSDAEKFEQAMKSEAPELFEQQPGLLFQLVTMMNPGRVKEAGVKVVACDQRPNEFVITFPKAYHCGFNHGINMNEAVNFALPDWLSDGKLAVMRYQEHSKPPVFSHNELLITITLYSETIRTALWLKDNLTQMVAEETRRRDKLRIAYPSLHETQIEEDSLEDQYQCAICKSFCYLAQITCTCTKLVSCLDHADQLCSCHKSKRTMRKRYTEAQLEEILAIVVARAAHPAAWRARLYALLETPRPPLKSMRALVADGEKIAYPMPEVQSLRALVDRANSWVERVSVLVTRKTAGRRRKGKRDEDEDEDMNTDGRYETLLELDKEAGKLAFDAPEIPQLRQLLNNISHFESEASIMMSAPDHELDLEECKTLLILGESLNVDVPEISHINNIVNRLTWFKKVEEEVDDRTLEYGDTVKLLEQAEEYDIPENHPTVSELKLRREKGAEWLKAVDTLFNAPTIKIEDISELIEGKELVPVSLDKMRQLESIRKTVLNWQSSAKNFLSANGSALAASRLCKNVSTSSAPINRVVIPEIDELQAELDHHAQWQEEMSNILEIQSSKLSSTMTYLKREFESHLSPEDDEPNDEFVCFCRGTSGAIMITCRNCQGEYHPRCVGILPKYANNPYQCEMCQRLLPGLSPSLNDFATIVFSERWNFKIVPTEFKIAQEIVDITLRFSSKILQIIDHRNLAKPFLDIEKIQHSIRKIYNLPLLLEAVNIETNDKVVFIKWLFTRLQNAIKYHNGLLSSSSTILNQNGISHQKDKPRTRGRKPRLIISQSYPREFHCICTMANDDNHDNETIRYGKNTIECSKCSQGYHLACVKAPVELSVQSISQEEENPINNGNKFWRCPCCAVKEAKYYMKGVEVRVQMKEQFGTDQYIDYRSTINEYSELPIISTLQPSTDVIILECTKFVPPILPEDFVRDDAAVDVDANGNVNVNVNANGNSENSRKKRKIRPSDVNCNGTTHEQIHSTSTSMPEMNQSNGYPTPSSLSRNQNSTNGLQENHHTHTSGQPQTAYPSPVQYPIIPRPQTATISNPLPPQPSPPKVMLDHPRSHTGVLDHHGSQLHSNGHHPSAITKGTGTVIEIDDQPPASKEDDIQPTPTQSALAKTVSPRQPPPHVLPPTEEISIQIAEDEIYAIPLLSTTPRVADTDASFHRHSSPILDNIKEIPEDDQVQQHQDIPIVALPSVAAADTVSSASGCDAKETIRSRSNSDSATGPGSDSGAKKRKMSPMDLSEDNENGKEQIIVSPTVEFRERKGSTPEDAIVVDE